MHSERSVSKSTVSPSDTLDTTSTSSYKEST